MTQSELISQLSDQAIGYFQECHSAQATIALQELLSSRKRLHPVTARSVYEGQIWGEEMYLIDVDALEFGMHCFREIHDIGLHDDNGEVCFETGSSRTFNHPDALVLVTSPEIGELQRQLPRRFTPPKTISLDDRHVMEHGHLEHHDRGVIGLVFAPDLAQQWLIVWARDLRSRIDLTVISAHSSRHYAVARAERARDGFEAPQDFRRRYARVPDTQRGKVYYWEELVATAASYQIRPFDSVQECQEFIDNVYHDVGLDIRVPAILKARQNSNTSHYHPNTGDITLTNFGMERWTVLHEAAHHIAEQFAKHEPAHGASFAGVLAGLLITYEEVDPTIATQQAALAGIELNSEMMDFIVDRCSAATNVVRSQGVTT